MTTYPTPVPEELLFRDHGGMPLACGHKSDGFIRGSANDPRYHCPICRTAEESIFSIQAREKHEKAGWGDIFERLCKRIEASPDRGLAQLAELLSEIVAEEEGEGWGHGHRNGDGWCASSGDDCYDCERLDRVREWVEAHAS